MPFTETDLTNNFVITVSNTTTEFNDNQTLEIIHQEETRLIKMAEELDKKEAALKVQEAAIKDQEEALRIREKKIADQIKSIEKQKKKIEEQKRLRENQEQTLQENQFKNSAIYDVMG